MYYRFPILKRGQVDFFSHKRPGSQRLLTSCQCNNMDTSLECPLIHLHTYTINNTNTSNLAKSTFFHSPPSLDRFFDLSPIQNNMDTPLEFPFFGLRIQEKILQKTHISTKSYSYEITLILKPHPATTLFTLASPGLK
jgi:hypothetical protein